MATVVFALMIVMSVILRIRPNNAKMRGFHLLVPMGGGL